MKNPNYLSIRDIFDKEDFCTSNNFDESYKKIFPAISSNDVWLKSSTYNTKVAQQISDKITKKFKTNRTILGFGNEELLLRLKVICDRKRYKVGIMVPNFYRTLQIFPAARRISSLDEKNMSGLNIVLLANPNNLNGELRSCSELFELFKKYPNTLFVIDEASILVVQDYSYYSLVGKCNDKNNFLVFSSFSKMYGAPLLRLSFANGNLELLKLLEIAGPTFPITSLSAIILDDILKRDREINVLRKRIHTHKSEITKLIKSSNKLTFFDTQFNCIFVGLKGNGNLFNRLCKLGVVGLDLDTQGFISRSGFVRLTVHSSKKKHSYLICKLNTLINSLP